MSPSSSSASAPLLASMLLLLLGFLAASISPATAQEAVLPLVNSSCNPANTRLLVDNNQLTSDCGYVAWCDASDNICKVRGCRRDEFPFGFNTVARHLWPELCRSNQFCPDEGSFCLDKVGLGQPCQLGRDDQCIQTESPQGVRCLRNTCVAVNATQDTTCIYENTIYTDFTDPNNNYGDIISRDNCVGDLFCNSPTTTCLQKFAIGQSCSADKECLSGYCNDASYLATVPVNNNSTGTCGENRGEGNPKPWVIAIIVIALVLIFIGIAFLLVRIHIKQTKKRKLAREEYWQGQRSVSEHARLLDSSNSFSSRPTSMLAVNNARFSSQSSSSDHNSTIPGEAASATSPLRREIQNNTRRYSDNLSPSATHATRPEAFAHPLQQQYSAHDDTTESIIDGASFDPRTPTPPPKDHPTNSKFVTPPQSVRSNYFGDGDGESNTARATSSALQQQSHLNNDDDADDNVRMRNRDARSYGDGWKSPDTFVNGNR